MSFSSLRPVLCCVVLSLVSACVTSTVDEMVLKKPVTGLGEEDSVAVLKLLEGLGGNPEEIK